MGLDIRVPIGGLFTAMGVLLAVYGLSSDPHIYERSLGININLEWGIVLLVFGVVMGGFGLKKKTSTSKPPTESGRPSGAGGH